MNSSPRVSWMWGLWDLLFLHEVQEQFVHVQDPPHLQVPAEKTQIQPHQFHIYSPIWPKTVRQTRQAWNLSDENCKLRTLTLRALARVHCSGDVKVSLREMRRRPQSQMSQCCECQTAGVCFYSVPGTTAPGAKMRLSRCTQARSKRLQKKACAHGLDNHTRSGTKGKTNWHTVCQLRKLPDLVSAPGDNEGWNN